MAEYADLDKLRRRRMRRGIILPFAFALLISLAFIGAALALPSPVQVAAMSDAAFLLLVLCPAAVCLFPLVIASLAMVALVARWQRSSLSPLRRLEQLAASLERNADNWLGNIDQRVLGWAVAFAPVRQLLRAFEDFDPASISDTMENEGGDEDSS